MTQHSSGSDSAAILVEALPYIQEFRGRIVVVKYGGNALAGASEDDALASFAEDIVLLHAVGILPVVVHGGGPQIGEMLAKLGMKSEFVEGLRVTDAETLEVARMVLKGQVNPNIVSALNVHGPIAVGISGEDANLITASSFSEALGFVGQVEAIDPSIVNRLLAQDLVPVIATIGADDLGQAYNINADTVAGALAAALGAEKLIFLTDVDGIRSDATDPSSRINQITLEQAPGLFADGTVSGGMIPKLEACVHALEAGVARAHVLDGRNPHALLVELFTDAGVGTMVRP
ncbi:MAG: acetylglutamate kinase [Actinobacteria bacterium]|nr:acetylglutamate kinase [Actinomycetota bacterium]